MGEGRNSCSKTDPDASFTDRVRGGRLKQGYNVQIAVDCEYIIGFRKLRAKGRANVRTKRFLLAAVFDLKKPWRKREHERLQTHAFEK